MVLDKYTEGAPGSASINELQNINILRAVHIFLKTKIEKLHLITLDF